LRDGLVKKGGERRKKFSWEKASKEYLGIYRKMILKGN
jgi:glycosyltransferase involved in cell wall biosynthesis